MYSYGLKVENFMLQNGCESTFHFALCFRLPDDWYLDFFLYIVTTSNRREKCSVEDGCLLRCALQSGRSLLLFWRQLASLVEVYRHCRDACCI
jgi:hypothetical protein